MNAVYDPQINQSEKRVRWKELISAWSTSDLTAKEFCSREKIKEADLKRWSYRLRKQQKKIVLPSGKTTIPFLPLQLQSDIPSELIDSEKSSLDVVVSSYCIRVGKLFDGETLLRLIRVLERMT